MQTTRTDHGILYRNGQVAQRIRGKRPPGTVSTTEPSANGFLRQSLLPLYRYSDYCLPSQEHSEQQFMQSLTDFAMQQGLPCTDFMDKPYPYNILLTHQQIIKSMKWSKPDSKMAIVRTEYNRVALAERECYHTRNTLFYIPVYPLFKSLKARPKCKGLQIILSVFAYLYHVVQIPYYRNDETFLYWQYEMIEDWIKSDSDSYEGQTYEQKLAEIKRSAYVGDEMGRIMHHHCHLQWFEQRVTEFAPSTDWDREAHQIGKRALQLCKDFPKSTLFDNVSDRDFDDEYIGIGDYVSFIHDFQGSLYDDIFQTVNEDFGNRGEIQEPTSIHLYGTGEDAPKSIGFEQQLFPLIDDLTTLLMYL